jgi:uncharacterized repeat protein (TIGR01451 family)
MRSSKVRDVVRLGILLVLMLGLVMPAIAQEPTTPDPSTTVGPTEAPTQTPPDPTVAPTDVPTEVPTEVPTDVPTEIPTAAPTDVPTEVPSEIPTEIPTETPEPTAEESGRSFNILAADPMTVVLDGPTSIMPGETLTYTVTMTNTRGGESSQMTILDYELGPGTDWSIVSYSFRICLISGSTFACQSEAVADGVELTVTYQSTIPVNPSADLCANGFSNDVRALSFLDDDNYTEINSNTVTTDVVCETTSIDLAKAGSYVAPTTDAPYGAIDWTLTVSGTGDAPLTDVTVTDDTVTDLDCDPATEGHQGTIPSLPPGDDNAVTCTASSLVTASQAGTTVTNAASVTGYFGSEPVTDTASAGVAVPAGDPFTIELTGPTTILPGDTLTYTITVANTSAQDVLHILLRDFLPTTGTEWAKVAGDISGCTWFHDYATDTDSIQCFFVLPPQTSYSMTLQSVISTSPGDALCNDGLTNQAGGEVWTGPADSFSMQSNIIATDVVCEPGITLAKSGTYVSSGADAPLGVIDWNLTVTNSGDIDLTDVTVTDDTVTDLDCDPGTGGNQATIASLAPGEANAVTCTATSVVTEDQLGTTVSNNASVTGNYGDYQVTDASSAQVAMPALTRGIDVTKIVTNQPQAGFDLGETVTYGITVTNTGSTPLFGVTVSDDQVTNLDCGTGTTGATVTFAQLDPGQANAVDCTASLVVPTPSATNPGPPADVSLLNTVTVTAPWPGGNLVDTASAQARLSSLSYGYGPGVEWEPVTAPGVIERLWTLSNDGNLTVTGLSLSISVPIDCDLATPGLQSIPASLAPGESVNCRLFITVTQADIDAGDPLPVNWEMSVYWRPETPASAGLTIVQQPNITLVKSVDPVAVNATGDVTWSFAAANSGNVTLTNLALEDNLINPATIDCDTGTTGNQPLPTGFAPGDAVTCTAVTTITQDQIDAREPLTNTAWITSDQATSNTSTATVTITPRDELGLVLTVNPDTVDAPGQVTWTYSLTNNGTSTLTSLSISDSALDPALLDCDATTHGLQPLPASLAPGIRVTCIAPGDITQPGIDAGDPITREASATSTQASSSLSRATVSITQAPGISLTKTVDPVVIDAPGNVTWSFVATNTGNVTLTGLALDDDLIDPAMLDCDPADGLQPLPYSLAPDGTVTCATVTAIDQDTIDAREPLTNTARIASDQATSNTASATVTIAPRDGLGLSLSVSPSTLDAPGSVTWTYALTNLGTSTLTGLAIDDPGLDPALLDCDPAVDGLQPPPTTLGPGGSLTCTEIATVDQDRIDAGAPITRDAVVTSAGTVSNRSRATVTIIQAPAVALTKTVDPVVIDAAGEVTWSFLVTNTGNVTLTGLALDDSLVDQATLDCDPADGIQGLPASLAPGTSLTCDAITMIDQSQVDAREPVTNTATVTSDQATSNAASATVTITPNDGLGLSLTVDPGTVDAPGSVIWTYELTNSATSTLTGLAINDPALDPALLDCDAGTDGPQPLPANLAHGDEVTCTALGEISQTQIDAGNPIMREATATSTGATSSLSRATVTIVQSPGIELTKTVTSEATSGLVTGDVVTYEIVLTNTGNLTVHDLTISDPGSDTLDCGEVPESLPPGSTVTCTATHTITETDMLRGSYTNTADASAAVGTSPADGVRSFRQVDLVVVETTASATVTTAPVEVGLTIEKAVAPNEPARAGTPLTYTFVVTNTGNVSLDDLTVGDPLPGLVWEAEYPGGLIGTLEAGATVTLTATYVVTADDVAAGEVTNEAAVDGLHPSCREDDDIPSVEQCAVTSQTASVSVPAEPEPTTTPEPTTEPDPTTPPQPTTTPDPTTPPETSPETTAPAEVVTSLPTTGGGPDAGVPMPGLLLGVLGLAFMAMAVRVGVRQTR